MHFPRWCDTFISRRMPPSSRLRGGGGDISLRPFCDNICRFVSGLSKDAWLARFTCALVEQDSGCSLPTCLLRFSSSKQGARPRLYGRVFQYMLELRSNPFVCLVPICVIRRLSNFYCYSFINVVVGWLCLSRICSSICCTHEVVMLNLLQAPSVSALAQVTHVSAPSVIHLRVVTELSFPALL